jgi:hypothetical protein
MSDDRLKAKGQFYKIEHNKETTNTAPITSVKVIMAIALRLLFISLIKNSLPILKAIMANAKSLIIDNELESLTVIKLKNDGQ